MVPDEQIYVLSAKYGVLKHDQRIETYDVSLKDLGKRAKELWVLGVKRFVMTKIENEYKPVYICGESYCGGLPGVRVLPKGGIGVKLQFMVNLLEQTKPQRKRLIEI